MYQRIKVPYGTVEKQFRLPKRNLIGVASPRDISALSKPHEAINEALEHPLRSNRILDIARKGQKVVILTSDIMRPGDYRRLILPNILQQLNLAGVTEDDITILDAVGSHEMNSDKQWEEIYCKNVTATYKVVNNNCRDITSMVDLGKSELGDRVIVNKLLIESDLCIGVGSIQPAVPTCGYSGGAKIYAIGAASIQTIFDTHRARTYWHPTSRSGVIAGNKFREHIESVGKKIFEESKAEFFTVDAVTNSKTNMIGVFAGETSEVYKEGCNLAQKQWRVAMKSAADIVIGGASFPQASNPYEMNISMAMVSRYPSDILKTNSVLIFVGPCDVAPHEGSASFEFLKLMRHFHDADEIIKRVQQHQEHEELEEPTLENFLLQTRAYGTAMMMKNYSKILVAEPKLPDLVRDMHFTPVTTIQKALDIAMKSMGNNADILVIPRTRSAVVCIEQ
jgi:nickel-dependent lactate racemase